MITIPSPESKKFSIPNISDLFGNIWYTRNINFDEQGYLKLSNRSVLLKTDADDAQFGIVPSFGRVASGQFFVPTAVDPYVVALSALAYSIQPDPNAGKPTSLGFTTWARWWNNRWHVASLTSLYYRITTNVAWVNITLPTGASLQGNWNASSNSPALQSGIGTAGHYYVVTTAGNTALDGVSVWNVGDWAYFNGTSWVKAVASSIFTSGNIHALEVFRNRNTLCVADGNRVIQFDTSYVHQVETDLIIPADFEVNGLAYNGNRMGVITRLANPVAGKNIDAYFFVWDGGSNEANAGYPIGSDAAVAVFPYKSSWVVISRTGQLLYYNGGGFQVLGQLPFYFQDQLWGDFINRLAYGDAITVDGDLIYINIASNLNTFGIPPQVFTPNFRTGIWCYDPNVGLYHRYSPSISKAFVATVQASGVDVGANEITVLTGGTVPESGSPVRYTATAGTVIAGLELYATYYVIKVSGSVFKLALTYADAIAGTAINLTSQGVSNQYFLFIDLVDYGTSKSSRVAGVGLQGVYSQAFSRLIYSGYYPNTVDSLEQACLCIDVPFFPSRGCFVTAKLVSKQVQDTFAKVFLSFSGLEGEDVIIIKYKPDTLIGIPVSTDSNGCTWSNNQTFTTSQDISAAYDYLNGTDKILECDIIAGAGGGQTSQITSITLAAGVYTVILDEEMQGIGSGDKCDVCLENWTLSGQADADTEDGYTEAPIGVVSKEVLLKVEMRGVPQRMKIESLQIINSTSREAK